eukprot:7137672-Lingulodinium_polyedra.AAC.1
MSAHIHRSLALQNPFRPTDHRQSPQASPAARAVTRQTPPRHGPAEPAKRWHSTPGAEAQTRTTQAKRNS